MEAKRGECFGKKLVSNAAKRSDMMRDEKTDSHVSQSDEHYQLQQEGVMWVRVLEQEWVNECGKTKGVYSIH